MAYPGQQYEVIVVKGGDLNTLGDIANAVWSPGAFPHKIVRVTLMNHNVIGGAGQVKLDKRTAFQSDTGRGDGDVAVLNIPNSLAASKGVYAVPATRVIVNPGEEVVCEVTDVTAAGDLGTISMLVEMCPETAPNIPALQASV